MAFVTGEPDARYPAGNASVDFVLVQALDLKAVSHILRHRAVGHQGKALEYHRRLVAAKVAQLVLRHMENVLTIDRDPA